MNVSDRPSAFVRRHVYPFTIVGVTAAVMISATLVPAQTTMPTTQAGSSDEIKKDLRQTIASLQDVLGGLAGLADAKVRTETGPKAIPLARRTLSDFDALQAVHPELKDQLMAPRQQFESILIALGDQPTQLRIAAESKSPTAAEKVHGQSTELMARWLTAGRDENAQKPIVDDVQKLDEANTDSGPLTIFNLVLADNAATPGLKDRLRTLATQTMKNPTATQLVAQLARGKDEEAAEAAADVKLKAFVGKPLVVTGKTVEGKTFSTADWKGKVVLVDFWATWCPPCRAELPQLKKIYDADHAKGLEIVGVSNDYDAGKLTAFTAHEQMPWPQLFDPTAAADRQWNSTTSANNVYMLPTKFFIDRKGICRSVIPQVDPQALISTLLSE